MKNPVSIVVPALNEEKTIFNTVKECRKAKGVAEVIVVDDKSSDNTVGLAKKAGAKIIISKVRGKGTSMMEGLEAAKGEIIAYVDADIKGFSSDMIDKITGPITDGSCDFVKSSYGRQSGRVTELLAKPLLSALFPPLVSFKQPLSGIIAGRKRFFKMAKFENDYGVDVGILIDMVNNGARIKEVNIGHIDHKMKPWRKLSGMSNEVARSIIKRATMTNRVLQESILAEARVIGNLLVKGSEIAFPIDKIAFLDMDATLIKKRFIFEFSKKLGNHDQIKEISESAIEPYAKTKRIASLLRGINKHMMIEFAGKMALSNGAKNLVGRLKKAGFFTVIISDSYESVASVIAERIGADMVIANRLVYKNGACVGDVRVNPLFFPSDRACSTHPVCKLNAAMKLCSAHGVSFDKTFAIGDSENDICLLRYANQSYAYNPRSQSVADAAKESICQLAQVRI